MEHFTVEQWADFARNIVSPEAAGKMQQHLRSGCNRCEQLLETMKKVAGFAAKETSYEPPPDSVRIAKALPNVVAAGVAKAPAADFMQLILDTFSQPAMAGSRVALASSRQLLYRKGDCSIDIRLEHAAGSKEAILVGQVLQSGQQGRGVGSILVELMSGEKAIAGTATTSHGEFQFLFPPADHLQLCVVISSQNCFWIKIPPLETIPESGLVVND